MAETARRTDRRNAAPNAGAPSSQADRNGNPNSDEVARRAYELYERRGGEHGRDWDDWFQAEQELRDQYGRPKSAPNP